LRPSDNISLPRHGSGAHPTRTAVETAVAILSHRPQIRGRPSGARPAQGLDGAPWPGARWRPGPRGSRADRGSDVAGAPAAGTSTRLATAAGP